MIFKIKNRRIDQKSEPLIIAEIGINHNGNLDHAIAIADSAIKSGVEVLKHQTHIPDEEMSLEARKAIPGNSSKSIYQIIKSCTLVFFIFVSIAWLLQISRLFNYLGNLQIEFIKIFNYSIE